MFTHAFALASSLGTTYACQTIGRATNIVCAGELRQIHTRGNFALGEAEYLDIIEAKTAELCACCCRLGAHYAGADRELEESLDRFGRNLGIAFQIVDDLLDLWATKTRPANRWARIWKSRSRLCPSSACWPKAMNLAGPKSSVCSNGGAAKAAGPGRLARAIRPLAYTKGKANWYADLALQELRALPASPAREVLESLTRFVVARSE